MHVDKAGVRVAAKTMDIRLQAVGKDVVVPRRVACLAAEDQDERWVEELEGFGPLVGFFCVVFFRHLFDLPIDGQYWTGRWFGETRVRLPWSPAFVAERPGERRC